MATKSSFSTLSSYAFADTMSVFDERIQLTVGAREQRVTAENFRTNGTTSSSYGESALSPAVGLVVKPWKNVSLYGNYIQGLQQGTIVGSTFANAGQVFPPYVSTQYEAGVKTDWGRFTTTLSAFEISQPSTIVDTATNTLTLNGEQRNRGIEFNVFGELSESVRLLGGAMFMDARMVKTQGGVSDGLEAAGVPKIRAVLGSEWDTPFLRGLTLNGRVVHTTSQFVDITNPRRSIPDWTTVDLGARYRIEKSQNWTGGPVVVRFNVENVLGQDYWATTANSNILVQGTPRTFRLSSTFNF
jgi:iron complex outermembrane receptor protein